MPAFVISPCARTRRGHPHRYDQYSVLRTIELILGLEPLSINDALATPMYDAFAPSSPTSRAPYTPIQPEQSPDGDEPGRRARRRAVGAARRSTSSTSCRSRSLDRILWQSAKGRRAPPPPGAERDPRDPRPRRRCARRARPDAQE